MSVSLEVNDVHVLISKVFGDYGYSDPHGTHVAGIAAANTNNDEGIAGIDWYAMINAQDVGNDPGIPEFTQAVIDAVDAGSRVINCSWGYPDFSYILYYAFIYTYQMGVLPVAALPYPDRNWENPNGFGLWMFTVNASENRDHIAEYTLSKRYTDIAAPGGEYRTTNRQMIISALPEGTYGYGQGTSMAAPHATGVAGLLIAVNPELKNYDLEWIMKKTSDDLYYPPCTQGWDAYSGYGRLNAIEAVKRTLPPYWITRGDASITLFESNKRVLFMNPPRPDVDPYYYWCDLYRIRVTLNFSPEYKEPPWG